MVERTCEIQEEREKVTLGKRSTQSQISGGETEKERSESVKEKQSRREMGVGLWFFSYLGDL